MRLKDETPTEATLREAKMLKREAQIKHRIHMAVYQAEQTLYDDFERMLEYIIKEEKVTKQ